MIRCLSIQAVFDNGNFPISSPVIDNPLNKNGIQTDYIPFAYYAYRKTRKNPVSPQFGDAQIYKVLDGWTGIELCKIQRYIDDNGKKCIRFFDFI